MAWHSEADAARPLCHVSTTDLAQGQISTLWKDRSVFETSAQYDRECCEVRHFSCSGNVQNFSYNLLYVLLLHANASTLLAAVGPLQVSVSSSLQSHIRMDHAATAATFDTFAALRCKRALESSSQNQSRRLGTSFSAACLSEPSRSVCGVGGQAPSLLARGRLYAEIPQIKAVYSSGRSQQLHSSLTQSRPCLGQLARKLDPGCQPVRHRPVLYSTEHNKSNTERTNPQRNAEHNKPLFCTPRHIKSRAEYEIFSNARYRSPPSDSRKSVEFAQKIHSTLPPHTLPAKPRPTGPYPRYPSPPIGQRRARNLVATACSLQKPRTA